MTQGSQQSATQTMGNSHQSKPNQRSIFNKTLTNSQKSNNPIIQNSKANDQKQNPTLSKLPSNRVFVRAKESVDKHVMIDLYQAVHGDDSTSNLTQLGANTLQKNELSKSPQYQQYQLTKTATVPVSLNTSKLSSPQKKRNSGQTQQSGPQPCNQVKIPPSKYAKSSMTKTRNNKVKAKTQTGQSHKIDSSNGTSPSRQRT